MKTRLFLFLTLAFMTIGVSAEAQTAKQYTVSGRILDADEGTALELVNITFENNSFWAVSDGNGRFSLKLKNGEYHYEVSYIGYETAKGVLKVNGKDISNFTIKLQASSLALGEVVVTAKESTMGSSSVIDQTALTHLQPKSVEDILQLTPGNLTKNPSLDGVGQAYIREIDGSNNNAMGTSIVVDGAPISNDASLQLFSSSKSGTSMNSSSSGSQSSTGKGVDLRSISPDNIESIEVIRGVPSAEYGNLTAGAVIIKTKQGATPLEVKGKADPNSKMFYMGKGFTLNTGGTVNLSADYSSSYSDIRFKAKGFERITGDVSYSHTFFQDHPLSVNAKIAYFSNINNVRVDKQQRTDETVKNENQGVRIGLNGDWNIKTALVSNLSYNVSVNYSHQHDFQREKMELTTGMTPVAISTVDGEYQSIFLNGTYWSDYYIDGKPLDVYAQLKGSKTIMKSDDFTSQFKEGIEYKFDGNNGEGLVFDPYYPPIVRNVQTVRPRPYSDIPAMQTYSAFFENKTLFPIGSTSMTVQAGLRGNYMLIDRDYLDADNMMTIDPRVNMEWKFLTPKNNSLFENLSISAGWGITSKMPPLAYLYPDKAYFDDASFKLIDAGLDVSKSLAVMTTKVVEDTSNPDLKPSKGNKFEIGLNFTAGKTNGTVTFFREKYTNEFVYQSTCLTFPYKSYTIPSGSENVRYENGALYYDKDGNTEKASYYNDSTFQTYDIPVNGYETDKMGVEYSINLGQIQALRTSVVVDGAWLWVKRRTQTDSWSTISTSDPVTDSRTNRQKYFPYQVLYPAGSGSISSRTNTNIRFITHIPKLSMVFSTTAQIVWGETSQSIYQDNDGNDLFYISKDAQSTGSSESCFVDPVGFRDFAGNFYEWDNKYRDLDDSGKPVYVREYSIIKKYSYANHFDAEHYPAYMIFNFRLTKQYGDMFEFSFMANNMFNTRKLYKQKLTGAYTVLTIPQYFGAEIKIKI